MFASNRRDNIESAGNIRFRRIELAGNETDDQSVENDQDQQPCVTKTKGPNAHICRKIREQIEFYLSDNNLRQDTFYRAKIISSPHGHGWFDLAYIQSAPRVKDMMVEDVDIVKALKPSQTVETKVDEELLRISGKTSYLIRRKGNKKLPKWKNVYKRRYNHRSDYGFGGGSHGFSGYDCDRLLEYGVKPWEEDADDVLGAVYGRF